MNNQLHAVKSLLSTVTSQVQPDNENISPGIDTTLFNISGFTRFVSLAYATMSKNGKISFHLMSPMKFIDPTERDIRYRAKTTWLSVAQDSNSRPNPANPNEVIHYNSNPGIFSIFRKADKINERSNPYNSLILSRAKIRQALVPTNLESITPELLRKINFPAIKLNNTVKGNIEAAGEDNDKELAELNVLAYNEYANEMVKLYEEGLLTLSNVFITPKQNSIQLGVSLDETSNSVTNPWLNTKNLLESPEFNITTLPMHSSFTGLVELNPNAGMDVLNSDNVAMLGERMITRNEETGAQRTAYSLIGTIKDFGVDVPVLVSIVDLPNGYSGDSANGSRSRVESLRALLAQNINRFYIEGTIRPVVRQLGQNGGRSGNVFMELSIDAYSVYRSTSMTSSMETDDFADLGEDEVESAQFAVDSSRILDALGGSEQEEKSPFGNNSTPSNDAMI